MDTTTKLKIIEAAQMVLVDLPMNVIKGPESLAQEIMNRVSVMTTKSGEKICKTPDEFAYMIDTLTTLILKTKGKEIEIIQIKGKGFNRTIKKVSKEEAFKRFGFLPRLRKDPKLQTD